MANRATAAVISGMALTATATPVFADGSSRVRDIVSPNAAMSPRGLASIDGCVAEIERPRILVTTAGGRVIAVDMSLLPDTVANVLWAGREVTIFGAMQADGAMRAYGLVLDYAG